MARSTNNLITLGLHGLIGDMLVFRTRNGKTFVSAKPKERTGELSEAQQAHNSKFQQATLYAKAITADPFMKEAYREASKSGAPAYNVAVADFFHAPDIHSVDLSNYSGKIDDTIAIIVSDDFRVKEVTVKIINADGTVVEQGSADLVSADTWLYRAKAENISLDGDKIEIKASDLPGNISVKEESM